jgi:hypothetical protein
MNVIPKRQAAIDQFWNDVKELLTQKHGHSDRQAQQGINQYRQATVNKLGEVVYNQGEEKTAEVIDGVIRSGLPASIAS